jgi:hypothetical protein
MVAGGGVGVRVEAASGPVVSVGVGSGVDVLPGVVSTGLLITKMATMISRITAASVTLRV